MIEVTYVTSPTLGHMSTVTGTHIIGDYNKYDFRWESTSSIKILIVNYSVLFTQNFDNEIIDKFDKIVVLAGHVSFVKNYKKNYPPMEYPFYPIDKISLLKERLSRLLDDNIKIYFIVSHNIDKERLLEKFPTCKCYLGNFYYHDFLHYYTYSQTLKSAVRHSEYFQQLDYEITEKQFDEFFTNTKQSDTRFSCILSRVDYRRIEFMFDLIRNDIINNTNYIFGGNDSRGYTKKDIDDKIIDSNEEKIISWFEHEYDRRKAVKRFDNLAKMNVHNNHDSAFYVEKEMYRSDIVIVHETVIANEDSKYLLPDSKTFTSWQVSKNLWKDYGDENIQNILSKGIHLPLLHEEQLFLTEKTLKAMLFKKPFILMSMPYSLEVLKKDGFKTFSPFIDESYDLVEDVNERRKAVIKELDRLNKLSDDEIKQIEKNCHEIVEYNYKHAKEMYFGLNPNLVLSPANPNPNSLKKFVEEELME